MWFDDAGGSLADWAAGDSYDEPRTFATVVDDIATGSQDVNNSGTGSGWGGFLQGAFGQVLNYTVQRDAAKSAQELALQRQQALQQQTLLGAGAGGITFNPMGVLLIGGVVVAAALLLKKG